MYFTDLLVLNGLARRILRYFVCYTVVLVPLFNGVISFMVIVGNYKNALGGVNVNINIFYRKIDLKIIV